MTRYRDDNDLEPEVEVSAAGDDVSAPQAAPYVQSQPRRMSAADFEQAGGRYEAQQQPQQPQQQPQSTKRMSAADFEQAGGKYEEPQQQQQQQQQPQPQPSKRMSAADFEQAGGKYEEPTSGVGSAVRGFLHGVGPMGAAVATGAGIGTAVGGLPGTILGGIAGLVTGGGASYLQEKAIEKVAPAEAEAYRRAREEHPYLTLGGELAAAGPYFGVRAAGKLGQQMLTRSIAGGAGAGIDAAQQLALEDKFDPLRTLETAAGSALLAGRPTRLGRALGVPGEPPVAAPAARPIEAAAAEPPTRAYPPATATEPHTAVTEIPDAYRQGQYPREEWTGDKYSTRENYGARREREFPKVEPESHGTPGPKSDAPIAEEPTPTAVPAATENAPVRAPKPGPEDYGKKPTPASEESGINVGPDPTLQHALTTATETAKPAEAQAPAKRLSVEPEITPPRDDIPGTYEETRPAAAAARPTKEAGVAPVVQQQQQQPYRQTPPAPEQPLVRGASPPLQPREPARALSPELDRKVELNRRINAERTREQVTETDRATAARQADMRQQLAERGYTPEQIKSMSPTEHYTALYGDGPPGVQQAAQTPATRQPAVVPEKVPLVEATESDKATGLLSSLRRQFGALVLEPSASTQAATTAIKKASGPLARLREQTASRLTNDMHKLANNMDQPGFERFVDAYESNRVSTLPKPQQELAGALKKNYDDFWKQVEKLPGAEKMEAVKNYLSHMYDNSNGQVEKFARDWFGAGGGSLRKRTHVTYADAREAGLTPVSNNPIEHFTRYSEGLSHHLVQRGMMADLKNQGRIAYFGPETVGASGTPSPLVKGAPPEGWSELKPPWAQQGGKRAYAPRDVAETINQFYNAGLRRESTRDAFEFARQTKNMWTAVELGLSAYHGTTMVVETWNSGIGRALQIAATGDFARATKQLLKTTAEPYTNYRYGRDLRKIYRDPTGTVGDPLQRKIMDIFTQANIQPGKLHGSGEYLRAAADYDMGRLGNFWDAHKRGSLMNEFSAQLQEIKDSYGLKIPKVALDNIRRAVSTMSKPLFEHYIPELKLGTMMKDMEAWLHANPNATDEAALKYASRIADSTDNRMGEMNYDNLFINKTAKDIAMLTLRSFGFTVGGPIREIGGGAGRLGWTALQGKNPLKHLDLRNEAADPRTAYALAFLPTIAAIGSAYQFMRTGKGPEEWRDLVTPQTGGMVKSIGQKVPERALVPGYHKDFLGYFVNPGGPLHELEAKMAAPWTTLLEQLTGKDWRGKPYVPPRASTLEWLQAHGKAALSHMAPISAKQLFEGAKEGSALTLPEQMIGVRTPGAYMLNPKGYEAYRVKQEQRDWKGKEKQEKLPPRPLPPSPYR